MNITILNTDLISVHIVDIYESFIWTDRYRECGDFELYTSVTEDILKFARKNYYILNSDSEHVMIVENIRIDSDVENGNHITVTGRSLESILERRIIWGQQTISGNLQDGIETLLNLCIINPSNSNRKIENFIFKKSEDPRITSLTYEAQYTGDNLLEVIQKICAEHEIGFKVTLDEIAGQFVFELYSGTDRSYDQVEIPYVVFSPKFENIINSNYFESNTALRNVVLVGGEGEGAERRYTAVGDEVGLGRREIFTDARDISSQTDEYNEETNEYVYLTDEEYTALLVQRGKEDLSEQVEVSTFEGQVETTIMYRYGEDFFNGDVVHVANEYGHESKARILEIVMSENESGLSVYPTFSTVV